MVLIYNLLLTFMLILGCPIVLFSLIRVKRRVTVIHRLGLTIDALMKDGMAQEPECPVTGTGSVGPIWVHALSVGEVLSAVPIVDRLIEQIPQQPLVFSSSTATGFSMARRLFAAKCRTVFYFPYDLFFSIQRVVKCVDPVLMVIIETDIWPNFLFYLKTRGIPVVLTNARLSLSSFRNYRLGGRFIRQVLLCIDEFGVQSRQDASRFIQLGAPAQRISVIGNVKFDQAQLEIPLAYGKQLRSNLGFNLGSSILVAGSTHEGEEDLLLQSFRRLQPRFQDLLLVLAPRDPARAPHIVKLCHRYGYQVGTLSSLDEDVGSLKHDIVIVNTIGILRDLYALADIAYIGGSLVPFGGHNPLEPAAHAKPIVFGPHMSDFAAIGDLLQQAGGAVCVRDHDQLQRALTNLLSDRVFRTAMGQRAQDVFAANRGATDRTIQLIAAHLPLQKSRL